MAKNNAIKKLAQECAKFENKRIKYLSKSPRIYLINFSDLENNWSPEFYDYEYQLKAILYVLKHTNLDNMIKKWETMKVKGIAQILPSACKEHDIENPYKDIDKILERDFYRSNYTIIKFHPDVVKFMNNLLLD